MVPGNDKDEVRDLIALGHRVRMRIRSLAEDVDALPEEMGPVGAALATWRVTLLALAWDISEAALVLGESSTNQVRAIRMLNRSLFEYALRLEYYAVDHRAATKDWINSQAWLKIVVRTIDPDDKKDWSKNDLRLYNDVMKHENPFEFSAVKDRMPTIWHLSGLKLSRDINWIKRCITLSEMRRIVYPRGFPASLSLMRKRTGA